MRMARLRRPELSPPGVSWAITKSKLQPAASPRQYVRAFPKKAELSNACWNSELRPDGVHLVAITVNGVFRDDPPTKNLYCPERSSQSSFCSLKIESSFGSSLGHENDSHKIRQIARCQPAKVTGGC